MTAGETISLLTGTAVVIGQLGTTYVLIANARRAAIESKEDRALRALELQVHLEAQDSKLDAVHDLTRKVQVETNGMKEELVNEVRAAAFAKGVKSEVDKK
jgi:hypothetical protein